MYSFILPTVHLVQNPEFGTNNSENLLSVRGLNGHEVSRSISMKSISLAKPQSVLSLLCALLFISFTVVAQDKEWRPITPAELSMTSAKVQPDADAEVLFWEVRVDDSNSQSMVMKHYIRVKVFTERGREKYSKVDIPFMKNIRIKNILARVIKPDGSITDLTKNDVFEREIAKTDKIKVMAKSFAVPNIEKGVIFEYKYQEVYSYGSAEDMRMTFQHDVPIQTISYYFKPHQNASYLTFNMDNKFVKDKGGFYRATMDNVPAIRSEPHMPPEDEVRSWLLLYYTNDLKATSTDFWSRAGGYIVRSWGIKDTLKPGKELKAAAAEIAAGATSPDDQMAKLYEFCKTKIKNISYDTSMTEEQKDEIKPNKSPSDTYKKLQGRDTEINELFASLATALGHEARLAFGGDKSQMFFNPNRAHESFIHFSSIAVKINGRWKYYSPGDRFIPYGMIGWNEEDTGVLLLGYKDYITTETPNSDSDDSVAKRTGRFKLAEDGTLTGTVKVEYTGHLSTRYKLDNYKEADHKREENLKDEIKARMSTAEIKNISIENFADPDKNFTYQYEVSIPNYAQRTGRRLFLQPGYFEYGSTPVFATEDRKYPIFFHFPWSENDDIQITLPKGYELENADAPQTLADTSKISLLDIKMSWNKADNILAYKRVFEFGNNGSTFFTVGNYKAVKGLFDAFHKNDTHMLTLRQPQ